MSVTKELIKKEKDLVQAGQVRDLHLNREGTFIRAYDWSAWLACKYLHDFKVNKRTFKGIDEPVAYIGFPETSLEKWIPEGAVQRLEDEKYLVITLPELMITDTYEMMSDSYAEWKEALPLTESNSGVRKKGGSKDVGMREADEALLFSPGVIGEQVHASADCKLVVVAFSESAYNITAKNGISMQLRNY